jgi:hypothetical protein
VFEKHKYDPSIVTKSRTWFRQQATLLRKEGIRPSRMYTYSGTVSTAIRPGNMYMFFYDPKTKDKLPYYDRFPLVFPFRKTENGFLGLNLHYLSYRFRIVLLDNLLKFKNTKGLDDSTRLKLSWNLLSGISKHKLVEPCVKSYLSDHLMTQLKMISPVDWTTALMMPVESFAKASATQVWKNTGGV